PAECTVKVGSVEIMEGTATTNPEIASCNEIAKFGCRIEQRLLGDNQRSEFRFEMSEVALEPLELVTLAQEHAFERFFDLGRVGGRHFARGLRNPAGHILKRFERIVGFEAPEANVVAGRGCPGNLRLKSLDVGQPLSLVAQHLAT